MTRERFEPTIRSQADLEDAWRRLIGPSSFGGRSVWMMLIVDDVPLLQLTEITEADEPDVRVTANLATLLRMLQDDVAPGARFAFLLSRPGSGFVTALDRRWASALYDAARAAAVPCEVVHLATKGVIRPIPPDELEVLAPTA
ncbi:hypothetical protein Q9S36_34525 [Microbacterium sp. ARD31]|uniref:hypothetical protein n=1 Tax=Microbacterium sp. ARD31 TaxID=2962576 RepID=UPI002880CBB6|nr:hypothetical protein [Microbacterium sp. ARD31]MDT0185313.1 hypothetical protein [Microbacterium sp. ARD31]